MNNHTTTHKIDELGRILIPKEVRLALEWITGDSLEVVVNIKEGTVVLKPSSESA